MTVIKRREAGWKRALRYYYLKLLMQRDQPDRIAGGVAVGVFLGFMLPPGIQIVVALAVAPVLRCNPVAAAASVWVSNPFTFPFIYPVALTIGAYFTGLNLTETVSMEQENFWATVSDFRSHGRTITMLWIGLLFMGSTAAIPSYYLTKFAAIRYQARRIRKIREKAAHVAHLPKIDNDK